MSLLEEALNWPPASWNATLGMALLPPGWERPEPHRDP